MNANTAEKKLIAIINGAHPSLTQEDKTAILLGIQALKYHLYRRSTTDAVGSPILPGETPSNSLPGQTTLPLVNERSLH